MFSAVDPRRVLRDLSPRMLSTLTPGILAGIDADEKHEEESGVEWNGGIGQAEPNADFVEVAPVKMNRILSGVVRSAITERVPLDQTASRWRPMGIV